MCDNGSPCSKCSSMLVSDFADNNSLRESVVGQVKIQRSGFLKGDFSEIIKFAYTANPQDFKEKFKAVGIEIKDIEEDAFILAELRRKGFDKDGRLVGNDGKHIRFSVEDIVKSVVVDKNKLAKTKFNFV